MAAKSPALHRLNAAERAVTSSRKLLVAALRDAGRAERELLAAWKAFRFEQRTGEPSDSSPVLGSAADQWLDLVGEDD